MPFIGFTGSKDGVIPLESKAASVLAIAPSSWISQLHSFVSIEKYQVMFVPKFGELALPLLRLLRKDLIWNFTCYCKSVFQQINTEIR